MCQPLKRETKSAVRWSKYKWCHSQVHWCWLHQSNEVSQSRRWSPETPETPHLRIWETHGHWAHGTAGERPHGPTCVEQTLPDHAPLQEIPSVLACTTIAERKVTVIPSSCPLLTIVTHTEWPRRLSQLGTKWSVGESRNTTRSDSTIIVLPQSYIVGWWSSVDSDVSQNRLISSRHEKVIPKGSSENVQFEANTDPSLFATRENMLKESITRGLWWLRYLAWYIGYRWLAGDIVVYVDILVSELWLFEWWVCSLAVVKCCSKWWVVGRVVLSELIG